MFSHHEISTHRSVADSLPKTRNAGRTRRAWSRIRSLIGIAALVGGLGAACPSAHAATVHGTVESPLINGGVADFGTGTHLAGAPQHSASVSWDYSVVNGQIVATARVRGVLYWDALLGGGRALLIVQFKRLDGSILATEVVDTGNVPGRDANLPINQRLVDIQRSSSSLHSVTIITADFSTGRAAHTGSRTSVAPRQFDHNIIIDGGRADFGSLPHVLGAPSLPARLTFVRTNGAMSASVTGRIFWDSFSFGPGTAIMSVEFLNGAGARLRNPADQFRVNGTGINANFPVNSSPVAASLNSGSLTAVRFTVGELTSRGFQPSAPARAIRFND